MLDDIHIFEGNLLIYQNDVTLGYLYRIKFLYLHMLSGIMGIDFRWFPMNQLIIHNVSV